MSYSTISNVPCTFLLWIWEALKAIIPTMIAIMFIYGAAKYISSADDPSGRQKGKQICMHSVIGALIYILSVSVMLAVGLTQADVCHN
ncbi:MAG: hypothetical protein GF414_09140 [Candidatus Altiarchaeales archaeon]|nr:hypothetical protein [Candidatus Altiarchaeales archaeon]